MTNNQNANPVAVEEQIKKAIDAAIWVTCSPCEWVWTHDQQVAMARYCIEAAKELALWKWLTDMRCTVSEGAPGPWAVLDVDGEVLGRGASPQEAIANAKGDL